MPRRAVDAGAQAEVGAAGEARPPRAPEQVHWSQVQPLAEVAPASPTPLPVNLADGAYDEDAARREFQEAVMAWRSAGSDKPRMAEAEEVGGGGWLRACVRASAHNACGRAGRHVEQPLCGRRGWHGDGRRAAPRGAG